MDAVDALRQQEAAQGRASDLFGVENGDALEAILGNIKQTFDGQPLYPTAKDRAAHLFYFTIKDHAFIDGTKRIASRLMTDYLEEEGIDAGEMPLADLAAEVENSQNDQAEQQRLIQKIIAEIPG